jgi:voltage-gated sodium channel
MYQKLATVSRKRRERERAEALLNGQDPDELIDSEDLFYEELDISQFSPLKQSWITFGFRLRVVTKNIIFEILINLTIILAGLVVGLSFYPELKESTLLTCMEYIILGIFSLEILMKLAMDPLRPWMFFKGKDARWNWFDFIIVIVCMPGMGEFIFSGNSKWGFVLRLMRLARVLKLLTKYEQLRVILAGLVAGIQSASYIVMLLLLVFYMFTVGGMMFFRTNDPLEFGTFPGTFITLARMATFEDWTDVLYFNMYGCSKWSSGGGFTYWTNHSTYPPPKVPHGQGVASGYYVHDEKWTSECTDPGAQPELAYVAMIVIIFASSLVMLSMFIGSIAIAMSNIKVEMEELKRMRQLKAPQDLPIQQPTKPGGLGTRVLGKLGSSQNSASFESREQGPYIKGLAFDACSTVEAIKNMPLSGRLRYSRIKHLLCSAMSVPLPPHSAFVMSELRSFHGAHPIVEFKRFYFAFGVATRLITETALFKAFIGVVIVLAGLLVGLETNGQITHEEGAVVDGLITAIFITEMLMKMIGEVFNPLQYFRDNWNCFDCCVIVGGLTDAGGTVIVMRLLRLLRVLKLIKALPQLLVLVETLEHAFSSIFWISLLLLMFFYINAILAIMMFSKNDPWHFGNLHLSLMTLFRVATLEDWTDVMYINQLGCDSFDAVPYVQDQLLNPEECTDPEPIFGSSFFFIYFVAIGNYVLLSLFIGVVASEIEASVGRQANKKKQMLKSKKYCKSIFDEDTYQKRFTNYHQAFFLMHELRPTEHSSHVFTFELFIMMLNLTGQDEDAEANKEVLRKHFKSTLQFSQRGSSGGKIDLMDMVYLFENLPWKVLALAL